MNERTLYFLRSIHTKDVTFLVDRRGRIHILPIVRPFGPHRLRKLLKVGFFLLVLYVRFDKLRR